MVKGEAHVIYHLIFVFFYPVVRNMILDNIQRNNILYSYSSVRKGSSLNFPSLVMSED